MKRILMLIAISAITLNLYSQNDNVIVLDSIITYYWDSTSNDWEALKRYGCVRSDCVYDPFDHEAGRIIYSYDANGNRIMKTAYNWDTIQNTWNEAFVLHNSYDEQGIIIKDSVRYFPKNGCFTEEGSETRLFSYNAQGKKTEEIILHWDRSFNWRETWIYNESGNVVEHIEFDYRWIISGPVDPESWRPIYKDAYIYNDQDNLTEKSIYWWDVDLKEWVQSRRMISSYDEEGRLVTYEYYAWDSIVKDLRIFQMQEYEYYENQKVKRILTWKDEAFRRSDSTVYKYDLLGNEIEVTFYDWDTIQNSWMERSSYTSDYDEFGNRTNEAKYEWDTISSEWIAVSCDSSTFDALSNVLESKSYQWNTNIDEWELFSQETNTYDLGGRQLESVRIGYWWFPDILLVNGWKTNYYWSSLNTSYKIYEQRLSCNIYPNPSTGFLTIETESTGFHSIEIISLSGQLIKNTEMNGTQHQIDLSSFQPGVYFITIRSEDMVTTRKIIKH